MSGRRPTHPDGCTEGLDTAQMGFFTDFSWGVWRTSSPEFAAIPYKRSNGQFRRNLAVGSSDLKGRKPPKRAVVTKLHVQDHNTPLARRLLISGSLFDLLSARAKCDFLWSAREHVPSVRCSAPGSEVN
jgi:hypothetical protein